MQLVLLMILLGLALFRLFGMSGLVLFRRFDDSLQLIRPFGPGERRGILAVLFQITKQKILQVFLGTLHALRPCLPGEKAEKTFDPVHPGGVRGREVKMNARA